MLFSAPRAYSKSQWSNWPLMTNEGWSQTTGNPPSGREHLTCSMQNCRPTHSVRLFPYDHAVLWAALDQSLVFCQTDCVFQMLSVDLRPHTLCPLLMLHESTGPMRKSVSQTLFRPLKNVRLPPSQCHKSFSTSTIPKVNVMFYGVLERTRGMLSNTSALQESLENMKLNDITPSHTNVKVNIMYHLFLTFTSRTRLESAGVFCGDFGKSAEWIETELRILHSY